MNKPSYPVIFWILLVSMVGAIGLLAAEEEEVSFNYDIRPIMSDTCFLCHGPDEGNREAELRFDIRDIVIEPKTPANNQNRSFI